MIDALGRDISYMRISVTDRCNLHCKYCKPGVSEKVSHADVLRYEEILRLCRIAVSLGITAFKVTGGEPLMRKDCVSFIRELKCVSGVSQVTITSNGTLLPTYLDALKDAGIDGITVSLDSLNDELYRSITGSSSALAECQKQTDGKCSGCNTESSFVEQIVHTLEESCRLGIKTKVNAVLLEDNKGEILPLAGLAKELPIDVRFIERMPIGTAALTPGFNKDRPGGTAVCRMVSSEDALKVLREEYPDLKEVSAYRSSGPARYYETDRLAGKIGMIDAVSHKFCDSCNRVRLTSTGFLKPCLCYREGADLRGLLREGKTDEEIRRVMEQTILQKPQGHCFDKEECITEQRTMAQIGG